MARFIVKDPPTNFDPLIFGEFFATLSFRKDAGSNKSNNVSRIDRGEVNVKS